MNRAGLWMLAAALLIGVGVIGVASTTTRPRPMIVTITDGTGQNPLPASFSVSVDGRSRHPTFVDDEATLHFDDVSSSADRVSIAVLVPERLKFSVSRGDNSNGDEDALSLVITDNQVALDDGSALVQNRDRTDPVADAARAAEAEASRVAAEAGRVAAQALAGERSLVRDAVGSANDALSAANTRYDQIWDGRDTAPWREISKTINAEVMPSVDQALATLDSLTVNDPTALDVVSAQQACAVATRDAYVRNASFDPNLANDENRAEVTAAWEATGPPCVDAYGKLNNLP